MPDNVSLLTMAALLIQRMDQLANCDWNNQFDAAEMRKEVVELQETWRRIMCELQGAAPQFSEERERMR